MKRLTVAGTRDPGDVQKERLVLKVSSQDDIGHYAVFLTTALREGVSAEVSEAFWFPDQRVGPGDLVVLYTKSGSNKATRNSDGTSSHFFYWGLPTAVLGRDEARLVVLDIRTYEFVAPKTRVIQQA